MFGELDGDLWRHYTTSGVHRSDHVAELLAHHSLEHESARAALECAHHLRVAPIGGQHDDSRIGPFRQDLTQRLEPAHAGHLQIHESDVGAVYSKLLDGIAAALALSNQFHVRLFAESGLDAIEQQRMIVHRHHGDDMRSAGVTRHFASSCFVARNLSRLFQPLSATLVRACPRGHATRP